MSKYDSLNNELNYGINPLVEGETLIWKAKPKKSAFVINKSITMAPFAILWLIFDSSFITMMFKSDTPTEMLWFIIPFFALHLMPVWIWLANVLTANRKWKNTSYYVTDKRIIIENGFVAGNFQTIYYKDLTNVSLRLGVIDKMLGVGDIYLETAGGNYVQNGRNLVAQAFLDIENPQEIYPKLQKIVMDIQTDIEYPNALRPGENPGYNTKYEPKQ